MEEPQPEQSKGRRRKDKINKVKNRAPAPVQITAEQLLREARERQNERLPAPPRQKVIDGEEMDSLKLKKRKDYEDNIKKNRLNIGNWIKYAKWEESNADMDRARSVFERALDTDYRVVSIWLKYIEMELRHRQINHARNVLDRAVTILPRVNQFWYKYTYVEELMENISGARNVFERWMEWRPDEQAWLSYIKMEIRYKEFNRARSIYERFLLLDEYSKFEKRHGDRQDVEDVVLKRRRKFYQDNIETNQFDYDSWFDLLSLLENETGDSGEIREAYEKVVSAIPPVEEKKHWRRYIHFWVRYALYEELETRDVSRTRDIYKACLNTIPHKSFTFSKIWIMFCEFEIRQKNLAAARKIMGNGIGKCATEKLYRNYISLETNLREFGRARTLYEKFIEFSPTSCIPWVKYAEMETLLGNVDRARALYELAISQENLNMPEVLWKSYIDFAISLTDYELVRDIYERLLTRTIHSKVWISYAQFEAGTEEENCLERARDVFIRANDVLKMAEEIDQRIHLVKTWKDFEDQYGIKETIEKVKSMLPKKIKKRRKIVDENGVETGWEEYFEY
ncbi:hypothetical protein HZS_6130, partial [Henneguya salminicola]